MLLIRAITTVLLLFPVHCYIEYAFHPIKQVFLIDEHVLFRFNLTNRYTTGLLFLTWGTPLDHVPAQIRLLTGGTEVAFMCPVVSRLPPSAGDFEFLPAGDSISVLYNVTECYAVTAGNYSASYSRYLSAKLIHSVTADTNYELDSFSILDLFVTGIEFCVVRSVSEVCLLSEGPGDKLFNTTLLSSGYELIPLGAMWVMYCVVLTLVF